MNKKVLLCTWVAVISIFQFMVDKLLFPEGEKIQHRGLEIYKPRSDFGSSVDEILSNIRSKDYYAKLTLKGESTSIDKEYIDNLIEYHREIIRLYNHAGSIDLWLAVGLMGEDLGEIFKVVDPSSCMPKETGDSFIKATAEIFPLLESMMSTKEKIIEMDGRVIGAMPIKDERGNYSSEAIIEQAQILIDLMSDSRYFVRIKDGENPAADFFKLKANFDTIYAVYNSCSSVYAEKMDDRAGYKLVLQVLVFLLLTVVIYRKELL